MLGKRAEERGKGGSEFRERAFTHIIFLSAQELDRFLAARSLPIGWAGLRAITLPGLGPSPEQILIWICMGDRVVKREFNHLARSFGTLLADFCASTPERAAWQQPDAVLFWTSPTFPPGLAGAIDTFMVRSIQRTGNCYLHAPVVLQHYLVVKGSGHADHTKVDISKYVQSNITGPALQKYLQGEGGTSADVLTSIASLAPDDLDTIVVSSRHLSRNADDISNNLRDFGPALISVFPVDARFLSATQATATFRKPDYNPATVKGWHVMVLLGIRPDAQEGHMCLVQNWHEGMELLEMSLPYLAATGCLIKFVLKPLTTIPDTLPKISAAFTEALADAGKERMPREQRYEPL